MKFYGGAVNYNELMWTPVPELLKLREHADKILKAQEKEANRNGR